MMEFYHRALAGSRRCDIRPARRRGLRAYGRVAPVQRRNPGNPCRF